VEYTSGIEGFEILSRIQVRNAIEIATCV